MMSSVGTVDVDQAATRLQANVPRTWYTLWGKRLFDIVISSLLLVILAPLTIVVALLVLIWHGRPILYRQTRPGFNGEPFTILKFRSMRPDRRSQPCGFDGEDRRITHKTTDDPRHTPLGRIMRTFSLDELPQLLNVLGGSMSLVGPRPELMAVVEEFDLTDHPRHLVRPGITGTWQVHLRDSQDLDAKLRYDEDYVVQVGIMSDLKVLLLTPLAVLRRHGE